ncbi:Short chain dehydrogenase [Phytophthora cinnamomi]|uniref:Short chain dehydrogenase n=1 Tax=Phytophthora cinnamomi TaxID=4785 RepID=UPI00355A84FE|nr:Short chain dehydrogenase [Phytophthora cinnamomi]
MSTKGKWLTIEQKCEVIAQHRREPGTSFTQLAEWAKARFELSVAPTRQTVRNIVQAAADIEAKRLSGNVSAKGRRPCVRSQELEDLLVQYVAACRQRDVRLTRRLLNTRAREILDGMPNAPTHNLSVGWLTRFMKRHGLRFQKDRDDIAEGAVVAAAPAAAAAVVAVDGEANAAAQMQMQVQMQPGLELQLQLQQAPGAAVEAERAPVDEMRQRATKRLREIEKEARELRKFLRQLDAAPVAPAVQAETTADGPKT